VTIYRCGRILIVWTVRFALLAPVVLVAASGHPPTSININNEAERLVREAQGLRRQSEAESTRQAITRFQRAASLYRSVGSLQNEVHALALAASGMIEISRFGEARVVYQRVLQVSRLGKDVHAEFVALQGISEIHFEMGEPLGALDAAKRALELSHKMGLPQAHADALIALGRAHYLVSDDSAALTAFREALPICREEQDATCEASALDGIGQTYTDLGDLPSAIEAEQQAMALWRGLGYQRGVARAAVVIGLSHSWMGDRQKALELHQEALRIFQELGDYLWTAWSLVDLGLDYTTLDDNLSADYYGRALIIFETIHHRSGQIQALEQLCVVQRSRHHRRLALGICRRRLRLAEKLGDPRLEAAAAGDTGLLLQDLGDLSGAIQQYRLALELSRKASDPRGQADALRYMGSAYRLQGMPSVALPVLQQAVILSHSGNDPTGEAAALSEMSQAQVALQQFQDGRQSLEAALGLAETLREKVGNPMLRAGYFASVRDYYDQYVDLLMQFHNRAPQNGFDILAFEASERSRARSLVEAVGLARKNESNASDTSRIEHLQSLQSQIELKVRQLTALTSQDKRRKVLDSELRWLQANLDELMRSGSEQREAAGGYAPGHVARLSEIQKDLLDDETAFLEFTFSRNNGYLWVITRDAFSSCQLPEKSKIERLARLVHELLTAPQPRAGESGQSYRQRVRSAEGAYWQVAQQLVDTLLPEVRLTKKRLVISAEGALEYIPFAALPAPNSSPENPVPLGEQFEVLAIPSASTLAALRNAPRGSTPNTRVLVFADPVFEADDPRVKKSVSLLRRRKLQERYSELGLILRSAGVTADSSHIPRLVGTRREAEAILRSAGSSRILLDFDANLSAATDSGLVNYQILHFATHGVLHTEHPELSGIVLSLVDIDGKPRDGYLRLYHVYNLRLSADLVVLSACNTALGRQIRGEGVVGTSRAFFYAGAKRVVASLWKVDDEVTSEFMGIFYEGMLQQGKSASRALHDAQMRVAAEKHWSFPYYWGAFVLQGDWR
jgi:CHAT domain-containing protein